MIDWINTIFTEAESEMKGLEWGRLYETYHSNSYNPTNISSKVRELYADPCIKTRRGIFEYILGGCTETKLLEVRVFDEATKRAVYARQKQEAEVNNTSNCPLCAIGHDSNKNKIWSMADMDADHVTAWSNGGATDISNCQMLCKSHNRAKGNK